MRSSSSSSSYYRGIRLYAEKACSSGTYSLSKRNATDEEVWFDYRDALKSQRSLVMAELLRRHSGLLQTISDRAYRRSLGGAEGGDYDSYTVCGAVSAYDKFDPDKATAKLSLYVYFIARQYVLDTIQRGCVETTIKIPVRAHRHRAWAMGEYDAVPDFKHAYESKYGLTDSDSDSYGKAAQMIKTVYVDQVQIDAEDRSVNFEQDVMNDVAIAQIREELRDAMPVDLFNTYNNVILGDKTILGYAEELGLPEPTIRGRLWRARKFVQSWAVKHKLVQA